MTHRAEQPARPGPAWGWLAKWLTVCALALWLPGCGPGTGGTGTGDVTPVPGGSGVNYQNFVGTWVAHNAAHAGTRTTADCAGSTSGNCAPSDVVMQVATNTVQVNASCWSFAFQGPISLDMTGNLTVVGNYTQQLAGGGTQQRTATLVATVPSPGTVVSIQDSTGTVLRGPIDLSKDISGQTPAPAACNGS